MPADLLTGILPVTFEVKDDAGGHVFLGLVFVSELMSSIPNRG